MIDWRDACPSNEDSALARRHDYELYNVLSCVHMWQIYPKFEQNSCCNVENASSHLTPKVSLHRAWIVIGEKTAWELQGLSSVA